jgi:hypothetical protein
VLTNRPREPIEGAVADDRAGCAHEDQQPELEIQVSGRDQRRTRVQQRLAREDGNDGVPPDKQECEEVRALDALDVDRAERRDDIRHDPQKSERAKGDVDELA